MTRLALALLLAAFAAVWGSALDLFFWSDDFVLLHYFRDTSAGEIVRERLLRGPRSDVASPWWRPGWLLVFNAGYEAFGLTPWQHRLALWSLHGVALGATFALLRRAGVSVAIAATGTLCFALAPSYAEAILWVCAAYNVLPAALCLLLAGAAYARYVETRQRGALALAAAGFLVSLLFREAGFSMPLIVGAAHLTLGQPTVPRRLLQGLGHALPFLLVVALHHHYLCPTIGNFALDENLAQTAIQGRKWLAQLFALPDSSGAALGALLGLGALFALAPPRGRFAVLWALAASFPFVTRAHDTRFMYFAHPPLALALALTAQRWSRGHGLPLAAMLLAVAILDATRIPAAIARARADAEANAAFLELATRERLAELPDLHVDFLPPELFSGSGELLDLYLGKLPKVVNHALLAQRPPFLIYGNHVFGELPDTTPILHFDEATRRYRKSSKAELLAGKVAVPMLAFRHQARVVSSWAEVRHDPQVVHMLRVPTPALALDGDGQCRVGQVSGGTMSRIEIEVDAPRDAYLVIAFLGDLTDPSIGGSAEVDGQPVEMVTADGLFNAVPVRKGSKRVVLRTKL